jgi:beta-galactosidase
MKKILLLLSIGIFICFSTWALLESRKIIPFDSNWKFYLGDASGARQITFNDTAWRTLNIPHDWSIEGQNLETEPGEGNVGYFPTGVGWYRKTFNIEKLKRDSKWSIEFDGVYMNSDVWINGQHLGKYPYGYSSFSYDITPYLKTKGNVIAVRVDNSQQPNSRWYTGSGIYRHVRLVETNPLHIKKWGVYARTPDATRQQAKVLIDITVLNEAASSPKGVTIKNVLYDDKGVETGSSESPLTIDANGETKIMQQIVVDNPALWSIESPNLYTLKTYVMSGKRVIDNVTTTIGIRHIEYDINKGFLLNGKQVKMKGVNLHHDAGGVGAAVPERMWERRLQILKDGGCNAVRTAHNIPTTEFLDLCDKMGILVMDEVFDEWKSGKRTYTYHTFFEEWWEKDLLAMLRRDRNHPSIVMWSIGNEIPDQSTPEGPSIAKKMIEICRAEDPTRLVTTGNDNIAADSNAATDEFLHTFDNDIVGYNYVDRWHKRRELMYSIDRHANPHWRMVGTETGGLGGARGFYMIGNNPDKFEAKYNTRLIDVEQRWKFTILYDYVIGDFMWTGIDYYGESRWPSRGATSGILDNCGFPKDGYYFYKSIWTDEPVLHLLPHWNWEGREGQVIPVVCYTNCDTVELFVNGKSYGEKYLEFPRKGTVGRWNSYPPGKVWTTTGDLHLSWDVVYEQGELKAVGKKNGKTFITQIFTTGTPDAIRLSVDRSTIQAHTSDVAHVKVEIVDKDGHVVPYADDMVKFEVSGAQLIGVENGNMMDLSSCKIPERKAFNGLCLAIVQADKAGKIKIRASSGQLKEAEIEVIAIN